MKTLVLRLITILGMVMFCMMSTVNAGPGGETCAGKWNYAAEAKICPAHGTIYATCTKPSPYKCCDLPAATCNVGAP